MVVTGTTLALNRSRGDDVEPELEVIEQAEQIMERACVALELRGAVPDQRVEVRLFEDHPVQVGAVDGHRRVGPVVGALAVAEGPVALLGAGRSITPWRSSAAPLRWGATSWVGEEGEEPEFMDLWGGWGYRHVQAKHVWNALDREETELGLNTPQSPVKGKGNNWVYSTDKNCSRGRRSGMRTEGRGSICKRKRRRLRPERRRDFVQCREMNPNSDKSPSDRYDEIEGEAYERYLIEVIRGSAAEEERLGNVGRRLIKDVRLIGDAYPHWGIEIDTVNPQNGKEGSSKFPFRGIPSLFDAERPRGENTAGSQIIGDMLVHIREGG